MQSREMGAQLSTRFFVSLSAWNKLRAGHVPLYYVPVCVYVCSSIIATCLSGDYSTENMSWCRSIIVLVTSINGKHTDFSICLCTSLRCHGEPEPVESNAALSMCSTICSLETWKGFLAHFDGRWNCEIMRTTPSVNPFCSEQKICCEIAKLHNFTSHFSQCVVTVFAGAVCLKWPHKSPLNDF